MEGRTCEVCGGEDGDVGTASKGKGVNEGARQDKVDVGCEGGEGREDEGDGLNVSVGRDEDVG